MVYLIGIIFDPIHITLLLNGLDRLVHKPKWIVQTQALDNNQLYKWDLLIFFSNFISVSIFVLRRYRIDREVMNSYCALLCQVN